MKFRMWMSFTLSLTCAAYVAVDVSRGDFLIATFGTAAWGVNWLCLLGIRDSMRSYALKA